MSTMSHTPADASIQLSSPKLSFLFEARIALHDEVLDIGQYPGGHRSVYLIKGGQFAGPAIRGEVIADSGGDWVRETADGTLHLDVRLVLRTDDGALIYVTWRGRFWAEPEQREHALDIRKPDIGPQPESFYFRTAVEFEVSDPRYAWLNRTLAVGTSRLADGSAIHRVFSLE